MKRVSDKQLAESAPYRKAHPRLSFFLDEQVDSMAAELIESRSSLARAESLAAQREAELDSTRKQRDHYFALSAWGKRLKGELNLLVSEWSQKMYVSAEAASAKSILAVLAAEPPAEPARPQAGEERR